MDEDTSRVKWDWDRRPAILEAPGPCVMGLSRWQQVDERGPCTAIEDRDTDQMSSASCLEYSPAASKFGGFDRKFPCQPTHIHSRDSLASEAQRVECMFNDPEVLI